MQRISMMIACALIWTAGANAATEEFTSEPQDAVPVAALTITLSNLINGSVTLMGYDYATKSLVYSANKAGYSICRAYGEMVVDVGTAPRKGSGPR